MRQSAVREALSKVVKVVLNVAQQVGAVGEVAARLVRVRVRVWVGRAAASRRARR